MPAIPTAHPGGSVAKSRLTGPPRKPQPGVNIHPDSRLAQPKPPQAVTGPHPFLQAHGFNGNIQSFNRRASLAKQGFENAYGQKAPPGVIWDVARNERVLDTHIPDLFKIPLDTRQLKPEQAHHEATWDGSGMFVHPGGKWAQRTSPLTALEEQIRHSNPDLLQGSPGQKILSPEEWHKKYPWISRNYDRFLPGYKGGVGSLGINELSRFYNDVILSNANVPRMQETLSGMGPKALTKMYAESGLQAQQTMQQYEMSAQSTLGTYARGAKSPTTEQQAIQQTQQFNAQMGKTIAGQAKSKIAGEVAGAQGRIKVVQEYLKSHGIDLVANAPLQANGIMDRQWMIAYSRWQRTPAGTAQMLQQMATENKYDPTPQGIQAMIRALKTKQAYVNSQKNLMDKWFAQSEPLHMYDHGDPATPLQALRAYNSGDLKKEAAFTSHALKDLFSYETNGMTWNVPLDVLHGLENTGALAFDTLNGAFGQATAWGTALTNQVKTTIDGIIHHNWSYKKLVAETNKALNENPSLTRLVGLGYLPANQTSDLILNIIASLALRGPGYWHFDETTPLETIRNHPWVRGMTQLVYNTLKDGVGDLPAAEVLFGAGPEAEPFMNAMFKGVRDGSVKLKDFHNLSTEYLAKGRVTLPNGEVLDKGTILPQVWSKYMPKHTSAIGAQVAMRHIKQASNAIERHALLYPGIGRGVEAFSRTLKGLFKQVPARNDPFYHVDPRRIESFVVNNGLGSQDEATQWANRFVQARGSGNTGQLAQIEDQLKAMFDKKFPKRGKLAADEPALFQKMVESENLTNMQLPGRRGRYREGNTGDSLLNLLNAANDVAVNQVGSVYRRTFLIESPYLMFKHGFRDPLAAIFGGAKLLPDSAIRMFPDLFKHKPFRFFFDKGYRADVAESRATWSKLYDANPDIRRFYQANRGKAVLSENSNMGAYRIIEGERGNGWHLMQQVHERPHAAEEYAQAAAQFLRNRINSAAYHAYETYKATGDLQPMVDAIKSDPRLLQNMREVTGMGLIEQTAHQAADYGIDTKAAFNRGVAEFAKMLADGYDKMQLAGRDAGVPDLLGQVFKLDKKNPGVAEMPGAFPGVSRVLGGKIGRLKDQSVARFLLEHQIDLHIPDGAPKVANGFDRGTGKMIRKYMWPNRAARAKMYDDTFAHMFNLYLRRGYTEENAARSASESAKLFTQYHLLDFANMIYLEQKYRGALPFFTKHRLFAKWVLGRIWQHPYMVVPIQQIRKHLDQYGRLDFSIDGIGLNVNLMRLSFLGGASYPYTLPIAHFIPGLSGVAGGYTRYDSLIKTWATVAKHGFNYEALRSTLDPYTMNRIDRYMAVYAINARLHGGLYAPVNKAEALKYALIRASYGGATRDLIVNQLSPVGISDPQLPGKVGKLSKEYIKLLDAGKQQAADDLLNRHPEVGMAWGIAQDFEVYNHVSKVWGMYDSLPSGQGIKGISLTQYLQVENKIADKINKGTATPADYQEYAKARKELYARVEDLKKYDAKQWANTVGNNAQIGGFAKASFSPDMTEITTPGPWYIQYSHNVSGAAENLQNDFGLSNKDMKNVFGYQTQTIQDILNYPNLDPSAKAPLIQQLERVQGAEKLVHANVIQQYTADAKKFNAQVFGQKTGYGSEGNLTPVQKAERNYEIRQLIANNYENPPKINGHKAMPFMEWYYLNLTPQELVGKVWGSDSSHKGMVGYSYSDLTFDEKKLLGIQTTPAIDKAWGIYNYWKKAYEQETSKPISTTVEHEYAIALNKQYPGFWRDYQIAHQPKAYVLLTHAKGAFVGRYSEYWKTLVTRAWDTYASNKTGWANDAAYFDQYVRQHWPPGFVKEYESAGGDSFLRTLMDAWG